MKFAAIKRSVNNDYSERESESYEMKLFNSKTEAANWLIQNYDRFEECCDINDKWDENQIGWKKLYAFFMNAKEGEVMFHWEWERRGNFRSYWISQTDDNEVLNFYAKSDTLYSFYEREIMEKSKVDEFKKANANQRY